MSLTRNRAARIAFRVAGACIAAALLCAVTVGSVLAYPQPLFPHRMEQGRLQLLSDMPFDRPAGQRLLAEVERRLAASPIKLGGETRRIVIAQAHWRRRLVFLWNYRAGGLNYYALRNVFLREADIAGDRLLRKSGAVPPPRTLAYYAAHEIGHSPIGQRPARRMPRIEARARCDPRTSYARPVVAAAPAGPRRGVRGGEGSRCGKRSKKGERNASHLTVLLLRLGTYRSLLLSPEPPRAGK